MEEVENKIKGGVIIIGSLFWENGRNCLKNQTSINLGKLRTEWRNKYLRISKKKQIKLPIRYGKTSNTRKNTYTIVWSRERLGSNSSGLVIPFKDKIDFNKKGVLETQVIEMAKAEGIYKLTGNYSHRLATDWAVMSIWIKDTAHRPNILAEWQAIVNTNSFAFHLIRNNPYRVRSYADYSWNNNILLNQNFELIDVDINTDLHFLLLAYTKADYVNQNNQEDYPNPKTIADNFKRNRYKTYFNRNHNNKIITADNEEILKELNK